MYLKLAIVCGFLVAFAAGMTVGVRTWPDAPPSVSSSTTKPTERGRGGPRGPGWMTAELGLSAEQQEQAKQIWSDVASRGGREQDDHRRQARRERDEAIAALVRPEDKAKFEQIQNNYTDRNAATEREFRGNFQNAVERTKQILTPEQRAKYEAVLQRMDADRANRDRGERGDRDRGPGGPGGQFGPGSPGGHGPWPRNDDGNKQTSQPATR